ncbi:D-amino-acid oxidase [Penicillium chermesinum]|uniref:D-amino-acid oxidase n=1 Tax=Penicillium chermesinum TaxID=63820 RepID=A0A9W9TKP4_9EURO|nr:D-amino-acid oxidase [Penicillium chermesinum]KAJ5226114.1 D-amino-acid oxidase [Penicillium chermesinum]
MTRNVVILGAGVSGLTVAYLLSKQTQYSITVLAKHMPGDYDIEYASPWAGANYMPVANEGTRHQEWETNTWAPLKALAENHPESGVYFQKAVVYNRKKDLEPGGRLVHRLSETWPVYKEFSQHELSPEMDNGHEYTSVCINTAMYLPWLVGHCVKAGVVFKRAVVKHIANAATGHHSGKMAEVVINCTGLSSNALGGVMDENMRPARGQIVLVRNDAGPMWTTSGTDDGTDEAVYTMTRAAGGGTILGGTYQLDDWNPNPDPKTAERIMKRAVAIAPQLVGPGEEIEGLDVIRHGVGLRPWRKGGPRVQKDQIDGVKVVHNYGHGGFGYQASFGCADEVVTLVDELLEGRSRSNL